ncbi:hypothetical protein BLTE_00970 [Blastochloris tepida]|uniref:Uncharacterized protein n=1 Tax=Blastochloris tepida TaxID=2233851 RepID=A0A348FVS9_9HYPH|nr:hypothetical protein BLTE_00970 [Blastochloris tepida]
MAGRVRRWLGTGCGILDAPSGRHESNRREFDARPGGCGATAARRLLASLLKRADRVGADRWGVRLTKPGTVFRSPKIPLSNKGVSARLFFGKAFPASRRDQPEAG